MKILVCVKVIKGELNPFDESALECALQLSDDVTVISMGPKSCQETLLPLTRLGAKVILISDMAYAGSDTLATSYILSTAIKRMDYDLILDPISKRRLDNFGEEDQFYIRNHHEAIISDELFESTQQIINRRRKNKKTYDGKRETFTRKYSFSCMLECGFCGSNLTRRSWHAGSEYNKVIWQCVTSTKKGKKHCPKSKGLPEVIIEQAFLESYKLLCYNNKDVIDEMLQRIETSLCSGDSTKEAARLTKSIANVETKKKKLLDMRLEELIDKDTFEAKFEDLNKQLDELKDELSMCKNSESREKNVKKRLADFRKVLEHNETLVEFDRAVFESIIEKVIVGGYDDEGNPDPSMLTFIYKTGFTNSVDGNNHKPPRKNSKSKKGSNSESETILSSFTTNEDTVLCSSYGHNTCGVHNVATKTQYVEILDFKHFVKHTVFNLEGDKFRNKEVKKYIVVKVGINLVCGNTKNDK